MSILIKGMEMPSSCDLCELTTWDGNAGENRCFFTGNYTSANYGLLHGDCPLIPVPPHGRLIDADAYEALIRGLGDREYRREKGTICDAIKFLHPHYAPTIIPAEEGE